MAPPIISSDNSAKCMVIALSGGATAVFFTAAACALLAGVLFASIHVPPREVKPKAPDLAGLLSGLHFMFKARLLFAAASLDLFAVLLGGAVVLLPIFARDILDVGAEGMGWLRGSQALGAVAMALLLTRFPLGRRAGLKMFAGVAAFGAFTIVFGVSTSTPLSMFALFMLGAVNMISFNWYIRHEV